MLARLERTLVPRLDVAELRFRRRITRAALGAFAILLGLWLVADLLAWLVLRPTTDHAYPFDIVAIATLAIVLLFARALERRRRVIAAGFLLATSAFLFPLLNALFAPHDLYLVAPTYLFSVLLAGALIGGPAAYLYAGASIVANLATWLAVRDLAAGGSMPFDLGTGVVFVLVNGLVAVAAAAILSLMSSHARESLDLLSSQAEQMATLANTDPLTGLANRRRLMEQFEREFRRALRYGRPLSLVYLDLDGFKTINDAFGHMFGDEVLQGIARSMLAVLRATDLLARVGGEEFALLLPETGLEGAGNVANKLRRALNAYSAQLGPAVPPLTFSAGISRLHDSDMSFEDMLARADAAQYLAKTTGKAHARTETELPSDKAEQAASG
jgi:diguanylate cyclase (GGDEF)-like protein